MPSFNKYQNMLHANGNKTIGEIHKLESDMIMDATWDTDISSRVGYLYDYQHDLRSYERLKLRDLHPQKDKCKIPIDIKYLMNSSQTFDKDIVTFHIQLRPKQKCNVPYYSERYGIYDALFPVGLYIDIPDESGQYNKWLVCATANFYGTQFPTYEILPCTKVLQWVFKSRKYEMAGSLRSQNSYNSGLWTDYKTTGVEDQQKFIVPLNIDSENLFYNQRMIIDNLGIKTEPRTWKISKINRINSNGTVLVTLAQTEFNSHTDYVELDNDGNVVGMWADLLLSPDNTPQEPIDRSTDYAEITFSGAKPQIKVGGSYKTLTITYYNSNQELDNQTPGDWSYTIDDTDVSDLITVLTPSESTALEDNQIKIKFLGNDEYIDKTLTITNSRDEIITKLNLDIVGL